MPSRFLVALLALSSVPAFGQPVDAQAVLKRTLDATGFTRASGEILHWRDIQGIEQDYQSNPPFLTYLYSRECWVDGRTGIERISAQGIFPGRGPGSAAMSIIGPRGIYSIAEQGAAAVPGSPSQQRDLDLWAVLADWRNARDLRLAAGEIYQEYPRTVLARDGDFRRRAPVPRPKDRLAGEARS